MNKQPAPKSHVQLSQAIRRSIISLFKSIKHRVKSLEHQVPVRDIVRRAFGYLQGAQPSDKEVLDIDSGHVCYNEKTFFLLKNSGLLEDAALVVNRMLCDNKNDFEALKRAGILYRRIGFLEESLRCLKESYEIDNSDMWTVGYIIATLADMDRFQEAIDVCNDALEHRPHDYRFYEVIALAFEIFAGRIDLAIEFINRRFEAQQTYGPNVLIEGRPIRLLTGVENEGWLGAIGDLAQIDCQIKLHRLDPNLPWETIVLLENENKVANKHLLQYFRKHIRVISHLSEIGIDDTERHHFTEPLHIYRGLDGKFDFWFHVYRNVQKKWDYERRPPVLVLTQADEDFGSAMLRSMGIPRNSWFVCLHVREFGFKDDSNDPFTATRNSDISNYIPAIKKIIEAGGYVIRMGDSTMKPLPNMEGVIDYALSKYKSERFDIFLCAKCKFFAGTSSGLRFVASSFGVPCLITNLSPPALMPFAKNDLILPKSYVRFEDGGKLSSQESLTSPIGYIVDYDSLTNRGFKIVDNNPDQLSRSFSHMISSLNGS